MGFLPSWQPAQLAGEQFFNPFTGMGGAIQGNAIGTNFSAYNHSPQSAAPAQGNAYNPASFANYSSQPGVEAQPEPAKATAPAGTQAQPQYPAQVMQFFSQFMKSSLGQNLFNSWFKTNSKTTG